MVNGYLRVTLRAEGKRRQISVHTIVLQTFAGPCPAEMEGRHLNGNAMENTVGNLKWGTALQNASDRDRHGRTARGTRQGSAKLDERKVKYIRGEGRMKRLKDLAFAFGVSIATISYVRRGETWRSV